MQVSSYNGVSIYYVNLQNFIQKKKTNLGNLVIIVFQILKSFAFIFINQFTYFIIFKNVS
jgi:hypothetical protein